MLPTPGVSDEGNFDDRFFPEYAVFLTGALRFHAIL